jgi:hypothetical protein
MRKICRKGEVEGGRDLTREEDQARRLFFGLRQAESTGSLGGGGASLPARQAMATGFSALVLALG